jgi:hypothetical protein
MKKFVLRVFDLPRAVLFPKNVEERNFVWFCGAEAADCAGHVGEVPASEGGLSVFPSPLCAGLTVKSLILPISARGPGGQMKQNG